MNGAKDMKVMPMIVREITSRLPRIKGLGVILAFVANSFRNASSPEMEVIVFGNKMLLNPCDYIGNFLIFTPQWYDFKERKFLKGILTKGDYVVDVGANVGAYTLIFSNLIGSSGEITAIEADEENFNRLAHNLKINGIDWVRIHNVGVSDKCEILPFNLNAENNAGAHSFLVKSASGSSKVHTIKCVPLFDLIERKRPKLIKLDIEGFEWRVLRRFFVDSPEFLWPKYILLEDEPRHRENDAVSMVEKFDYKVVSRFGNNVFMVR